MMKQKKNRGRPSGKLRIFALGAVLNKLYISQENIVFKKLIIAILSRIRAICEREWIKWS